MKYGNKSSFKKETGVRRDIYLPGSKQETNITPVIKAGRFSRKELSGGHSLVRWIKRTLKNIRMTDVGSSYYI